MDNLLSWEELTREQQDQILDQSGHTLDQIDKECPIFVSDDYFEIYAADLAYETGGIDYEVWPANCIDWTKAAEELKDYYKSVIIDGEEYWFKAW